VARASVVEASKGVLPVDVTSFVGRRDEVAAAKHLLATSRLVTLTGVGGVGKTRLALKVTGDVRRAFAGNVWVVELDRVTDPELLVQTVATTLGLRDQPSRWTAERLAGRLADTHMLLVLDNCEHLIQACAEIAGMLLRHCPDVRLLATSREALAIRGEAVLVVPPMRLPEPDRIPSVEELVRYDALRLLVDRARATVPSFRLTKDNQAALLGICRQLDGIPLAIELAAARLRVLSPEQILDRLGDRLKLLSPRTRGSPLRQQTMRTSIDWSYGLCSEEERRFWARMAVFVGGFELDAAEGICADEVVPADEVLDVVAALVDKSILVRDEWGPVVRYRALESIRQYGEEKLGPEDAGLLRSRHRDWYAALVQRARAEWIGDRQIEWISRLEREHANLRTALDFSLTAADDAGLALEMAASLKYYWLIRGLLSEGRHWLDRGLGRRSAPTTSRARALPVGAWLASVQGDLAVAEAMLSESDAIAEQTGDVVFEAHTMQVRGLRALLLGDTERAITSIEQALRRFTGKDLTGEVESWMLLAMIHGVAGDPERAEHCHGRCLELTESSGEAWFRSYSSWALGLAAWRLGDHARARTLEAQSLRLKRGLDDDLGVACCLEALAYIETQEGEFDRAATLLGAASRLWRSIGTDTSAFRELAVYHTDCVTACTGSLGHQEYRAASARGESMARASAVGYALAEEATRHAPERPPTSGLTRREREVAQLLAQGMSNKEIGRRLVISQRTAEAHVEHILTKLGFASRAQVANWLTEQQNLGS
jgi:predicted ATPase/DNA-binding CsgD family transcriptional regulator